MPTLIGKAVLWGNELTSAAIISDTTGIPTDATFSWITDTDELLNASGSLVGKCHYGFGKRFTLTVIPADRTGTPAVATARTNMDALLPAPGTTLTLADAHSGVTDATNTGKFQVVRSTLKTVNNGPAVVELEVVQYTAHDITTTVA